MGNRSFSSSGSLWQYVSAIQNLNKKPWKNFSQGIILCSPSFPTSFYYVEVLWLREMKHTFWNYSISLLFWPSPSFPLLFFRVLQVRGLQTRPARGELVRFVLVLMTGCFVVFWEGLLKLRICCAKFVHSVIDTEKWMLRSDDFWWN